MSLKSIRNKNRQQRPIASEIHIKYSMYASGIMNHWIEKLNLSSEIADKLIYESTDFINSNLVCNKCGCILPDDMFYKQTAQYANRGRAQTCKLCWKSKYNFLKGTEYND